MPVGRRLDAAVDLPDGFELRDDGQGLALAGGGMVLRADFTRLLPRLREGDILAALDAGAYGYVMASTYNSRLRPAEVLIGEDGAARLIRRRETLEDLASTLLCSLN